MPFQEVDDEAKALLDINQFQDKILEPKKAKVIKRKKGLKKKKQTKPIEIDQKLEKSLLDSQRSYTGAGIKDFLLDLKQEEEEETRQFELKKKLLHSDIKK